MKKVLLSLVLLMALNYAQATIFIHKSRATTLLDYQAFAKSR